MARWNRLKARERARSTEFWRVEQEIVLHGVEIGGGRQAGFDRGRSGGFRQEAETIRVARVSLGGAASD